MRDRFVPFLLFSRWACAVLALVYHLRFLQFVDYDSVQARTALSAAFYFLSGYGHEWFAVFFVLDGIVAGLVLARRRGAAWRHLGALYAILLPGLLLGAALDSAGVRYLDQSGIYNAYPAFSTLTLGHAPLLGDLFMLQPFAVPTYGSNGMLYLLSYLFWCFVLACLLVRAAAFGRAGRVAGFAFFFHFPVMMLLVAAATVLLHQPLMRQPTPAGHAGFVLCVAACLAATVGAARASDAVLRRVPARVLGHLHIRIHSLMKSVSSRDSTER